ncbi:hypothetical protein BKA70DRAFT_1218498 [Coprinopsis sp. MPI-PUGE-AT-0042]|nr:hypothetical protein BKA70DRAFT_1218498 [Coprinopsis sp. MPI-PUGE-AT-0042]
MSNTGRSQDRSPHPPTKAISNSGSRSGSRSRHLSRDPTARAPDRTCDEVEFSAQPSRSRRREGEGNFQSPEAQLPATLDVPESVVRPSANSAVASSGLSAPSARSEDVRSRAPSQVRSRAPSQARSGSSRAASRPPTRSNTGTPFSPSVFFANLQAHFFQAVQDSTGTLSVDTNQPPLNDALTNIIDEKLGSSSTQPTPSSTFLSPLGSSKASSSRGLPSPSAITTRDTRTWLERAGIRRSPSFPAPNSPLPAVPSPDDEDEDEDDVRWLDRIKAEVPATLTIAPVLPHSAYLVFHGDNCLVNFQGACVYQDAKCGRIYSINAWIPRESPDFVTGDQATKCRTVVLPGAIPHAAMGEPDHPGPRRVMTILGAFHYSGLTARMAKKNCDKNLHKGMAECLAGFTGLCMLPGCQTWRTIYRFAAFISKDHCCNHIPRSGDSPPRRPQRDAHRWICLRTSRLSLLPFGYSRASTPIRPYHTCPPWTTGLYLEMSHLTSIKRELVSEDTEVKELRAQVADLRHKLASLGNEITDRDILLDKEREKVASLNLEILRTRLAVDLETQSQANAQATQVQALLNNAKQERDWYRGGVEQLQSRLRKSKVMNGALVEFLAQILVDGIYPECDWEKLKLKQEFHDRAFTAISLKDLLLLYPEHIQLEICNPEALKLRAASQSMLKLKFKLGAPASELLPPPPATTIADATAMTMKTGLTMAILSSKQGNDHSSWHHLERRSRPQ